MKDVKECAEFYETLLNKNYIFKLDDGSSFEIFFLRKNFHHLIGLEKLEDIDSVNVKYNSPELIYKMILNGSISAKTISKSPFYHKISERVENFQKIKDMLDIEKNNKVIVDFDRTLVKNENSTYTKLINTKYILYINEDFKYIIFTLGKVSSKIFPETFFCEHSKKYVTKQNYLGIIDIEVVEKNKKNKNNKPSSS